MEALPSLPPELLAFAAPLARETAPLLASGAAEAEPEGAALPFELYLALMTAPPPTGEAWPASGKELPVASAVAAPPSQSAGLPTMPAPDVALLARLGLVSAGSGAQSSAAEPLPVLSPDVPPQPLPPSGERAVSPIDDAVPIQTAAADLADAVRTGAADALPPELAEAVTPATPADGADVADLLERAAAPDARAVRAQPLAADPELAPAIRVRSAPGAADARHVDAAGRDGTPIIEVAKLSQAVSPAVAAHAANEWLPPSHATTSTTQAATAQPAAGTGSPVDVRAPNWQEAFANRVQWLAGSRGGEARITLNPPELGAVDVKVSLVDDQTYVQLTTATTAARDELAQSLPRLRELFAASGIELGGASVHDGSHGNRAFGESSRTAPPEPRLPASFADLADEPAMPAAPRRSLSRIDLFA